MFLVASKTKVGTYLVDWERELELLDYEYCLPWSFYNDFDYVDYRTRKNKITSKMTRLDCLEDYYEEILIQH